MIKRSLYRCFFPRISNCFYSSLYHSISNSTLFCHKKNLDHFNVLFSNLNNPQVITSSDEFPQISNNLNNKYKHFINNIFKFKYNNLNSLLINEIIPSTQKLLVQIAEKNLNIKNFCIISERQTEGIGRTSKVWE